MTPVDRRKNDAPDEEMVGFLERDQLVADRTLPIGPATLGTAPRIALWALRIFVLVVGAMVIYTFFAQL